MDGRRARLIGPVLESLPRLTRSAPQPAQRTERLLPTGWAALLGVGWPLAFAISFVLEPAPAHHEAATPLLVQLGSDLLFAALLITVVAAVHRHPGAAAGGIGTGFIALGFAVACPFSGHHTFGLWWIGELAVMAAMLAVSVAALGRGGESRGGRWQWRGRRLG